MFLDFYDMLTNENYFYHTPQVEILEIVVEHCLATSMEDPILKPEQDW